MPTDPYALAGLQRAFRPRRLDDIELLPEGPPPLPMRFRLPSPLRALSTEPDLSRLPEVAQPLAPGEVYSQKAYTGDLMKGTAQFPAGRVLGNEAALAGLKAAQGEQNIPGLFSLPESELTRLASRSPETTAPGASTYFANQLRDEQARHASFLASQRKIQEGIEGAIGGLHPAVQEHAERAAVREALPQVSYGQAQLGGMLAGAASRRDVAEANLEGRLRQADMSHLNALAAAIAAIQRKPNVKDEDIYKIRELQDAYDNLVNKIRSEGGQVVTTPGGADEDDYEYEDEESLF